MKIDLAKARAVEKMTETRRALAGIGLAKNAITGVRENLLRHGSPSPSTVGVPLSDVSAYIADEQGFASPEGETGGLLLRGSNVFRGCSRAPEMTPEAFRH